MSGINSILDTLLHQVLGKRVDTAPARPLTEPVRPTLPAQAVQALRSESRPQSSPSFLSDKLITAGESRERPDALQVQTSSPASGSARTHFSAAARTIANLLARYPAPPSAIRPLAPLQPAGDGPPESLAHQLRVSIERSGLFYESHLGRWFNGKESGEQLSREPQMRLTRVPPQLSSSVLAATAESATSAPRSNAVSPEVTPAKPEAGLPADEETAFQVRTPIDRTASESLQGLLRHQLEMLAAPALRWEGEVWPGMTMSLLILPPEPDPNRDHHDGEDGGGGQEDESEEWQSQLTLRLPNLGEIGVRLKLRGERIELVLCSVSEATAERLRHASRGLRERLGALGFEEITLTVEAQT